MAQIRPSRIKGVWTDGYVLDLHSTGSTLLGHNEYGHPEFETHRTEMGELLYRLKYRGESSALEDILDTAEEFIRSWGVKFAMIVPVPPHGSAEGSAGLSGGGRVGREIAGLCEEDREVVSEP